MARLVRTLRVRRGARCREKPGRTKAALAGTSHLVRTLRVRRGAPRLRASTLAESHRSTFAVQTARPPGQIEQAETSRPRCSGAIQPVERSPGNMKTLFRCGRAISLHLARPRFRWAIVRCAMGPTRDESLRSSHWDLRDLRGLRVKCCCCWAWIARANLRLELFLNGVVGGGHQLTNAGRLAAARPCRRVVCRSS